MTTHELAKELLNGPDQAVVIGMTHANHHISDVSCINTGKYPTPSWDENPGEMNPVTIIETCEETLNENEELELDE